MCMSIKELVLGAGKAVHCLFLFWDRLFCIYGTEVGEVLFPTPVLADDASMLLVGSCKQLLICTVGTVGNDFFFFFF